MSSWERQKGEIESYNTFYAAFTGRVSSNSFSDKGYFIPAIFPTIKDRREGIEAKPDFTLYNGRILLLVEVKQGRHFDPPHMEQMESLNGVTIERAEEFVKGTTIPESTPHTGDVETVEACIAYQGIDEEYIEKCRNQWENCSSALQELEELAPVLAQGVGSTLRLVAGEFDSSELQSWLKSGIELPKHQRTQLFLTDGMEIESLIVAIAQIWGEEAAVKEVTLTPSDVSIYFNHRELPLDRVIAALRFLSETNVCEQISEREYEFRREHVDRAMGIADIVSDADDFQSGLADF